jgi:hypothetical protein
MLGFVKSVGIILDTQMIFELELTYFPSVTLPFCINNKPYWKCVSCIPKEVQDEILGIK